MASEIPLISIPHREPNWGTENKGILLEIFVNQTSANFGIKEKIAIRIVDEPYILECNTVSKTIFVSKHIIQNYGLRNVNTLLDVLIDELPNDPQELKKYLFNLSQGQIDIYKQHYTPNLSDVEVESGLTHEIGHIFFQHRTTEQTPTIDRHLNELQADHCAYTCPRTSIGFTRDLKRRLLGVFLLNGKDAYEKLQEYKSHSHPSNDERLACAAVHQLYIAKVGTPFLGA